MQEAKEVLEWMLERKSGGGGGGGGGGTGATKGRGMGRIPFLIVGNKQDGPQARTPAEVARGLRLEEVGLEVYAVQGMTAVEGRGVEEGMSWLVDQVLALEGK